MSRRDVDRREFLGLGLRAAGAVALTGAAVRPAQAEDKALFKISLAEWSLHKALFAKKVKHLDFAKIAKRECGVEAVEYVNQFFFDKAKDKKYLADMKDRAESEGVLSLLIMIDGEGRLGDPDKTKRRAAVEKHFKWVEAAKQLGCHAIRVNAGSGGSYEEQVERAADGLRQLTEFGAEHDISVIVENHGGLSSNGQWLATVIEKVDHPGCGTLPDFGNFRVSRDEEYDRYKGVKELMPFAKAVSAKSHDFDEQGNEVHTDYMRMMKIVLAANYHGYVGIEYEGSKLGEFAGIAATKKLLERVRDELS